MRIANKNAREGFTLVELMIVVAIVGVLAVLAVYGVRKYIANAKTAEARNSLGQISKDAATAYEKESMSVTGVLAQGSASSTLRQLCGSASAAIPAAAPSGAKYQSKPGDWNADCAANTGFCCLKFSMDQPQYYSYNYTASGTTGAQGDTFTAVAQGDLNGDGVKSTFQVGGAIGSGMVLNISPTVAETNAEE